VTGLQLAIVVAYMVCLAPLSLYGLHRPWMVWGYASRSPRDTPGAPSVWPSVTVQLPLFNERDVAERLILACVKLDYPRDRLQIQVLDDSTDDTTLRCARLVGSLQAAGHDIQLLHRGDRTGFKAGALAAGTEKASGELLAVFDADFVPTAGFLRLAIPWFQDGVGMVQARWGHLNAGESWLTGAQATLLDGHFVVEHTARHRTGGWFNFNGTAGIWRREAIADAGGWAHDTLTEDLDLSYRAQLAGWRFVYLDDVVVPAELPSTMAAFKTQQHRWAKGSVQVAKKLLVRLWRAPIPVKVKLEATAHLTANVAHPLVVALSVLLPLSVWARGHGAPWPMLALDVFVFLASVVSIAAYYGVAIVGSGAGGVPGRLLRLPLVFALGLGIALAQTRAVAEGLWGDVGVFVRTPKQGASGGSYRSKVHAIVGAELLVALWLTAGVIVAVVSGYLASLPFLLLFATGWGLVAVHSLRDALPERAATMARPATAGPQVTANSHVGACHAPVSTSSPARTP